MAVADAAGAQPRSGQFVEQSGIGLGADGKYHGVGVTLRRSAIGQLIAHAVAVDRRNAGPGDQLAAMHTNFMQHPPAPHNGQLPAQVSTAFQYGDLTSAGNQKFRQLQAYQAATDNGHALAQRHPHPRQFFHGFTAISHASQAAGLHQCTLGEGQFAFGYFFSTVTRHQTAQFVATPDMVLIGAGDGRCRTFGTYGHQHLVGTQVAQQGRAGQGVEADINRRLLHLHLEIFQQAGVFGIGEAGEKQRATEAVAALEQGHAMAA